MLDKEYYKFDEFDEFDEIVVDHHIDDTLVNCKLIGGGSYADIYVDINENSVWKISKDYDKKVGVPVDLIREITNINNINMSKDNYILPINQILVGTNKIAFSMPKADCNLDVWIKKTSFGERMKNVDHIFRKLLETLTILEKNNLIHGDIKPENILCNKNPFDIWLADFGLSRKMFGGSYNIKILYTLFWRPPEILLSSFNKQYISCTNKTDIWALGMILCQVILGEPILKRKTEQDNLAILAAITGYGYQRFIKKLENNKIDGSINLVKIFKKKLSKSKYNALSPYLIDLLEKMLIIDPIKRCGLNDIAQHPYFGTNKVEITKGYQLSQDIGLIGKRIDYFEKNDCILTPNRKKILFEYFADVCLSEGIEKESFLITLDIFDRYMSIEYSKIGKRGVVFVMMSSFFLSLKYLSNKYITIDNIVCMIVPSLSKERLRLCEKKVYSIINHTIYNPQLDQFIIDLDKIINRHNISYQSVYKKLALINTSALTYSNILEIINNI